MSFPTPAPMANQCCGRFEHELIILAVSCHSNIILCIRVNFFVMNFCGRKKTPSQRDEVLDAALERDCHEPGRNTATIEEDCRDIFVVLRESICETG